MHLPPFQHFRNFVTLTLCAGVAQDTTHKVASRLVCSLVPSNPHQLLQYGQEATSSVLAPSSDARSP